MKYRYISLTLLAALVATLNATAQSTAPKLVVNITIDQLRMDYLEAFSPLYGNEGFKKLLGGGMVYTNASYPFAPVSRASAVTSITTGTTPYYNSIVGDRWLNRETLRPVYCVDDNKYIGINTHDKSSPKNIKTSTLADEMNLASDGKSIVYSVAPFRDAAILAGGHACDGALWIDDNNGNWSSSTYYFEKKMPKWLSQYIEAKNLDHSITNTTWTPKSGVVGSYNYILGGGETKPFSHKFTGTRGYITFKTSGLVNKDVTDMALECLKSNQMGGDGVTDLLNVVYYAGTFDHKTVSNSQVEIQDIYVRLDEEIARLITDIEQRVGRGNALIVITGTGTSETDITNYAKYKIPTGTFYINRSASLLNMYLGAIWGQGKYVEAVFGNQLFINKKLVEQKSLNLVDVVNRSTEILSQMEGVRGVYTSYQLALLSSERLRRLRNGFSIERNGEISIEINPGWQLYNEENLDNSITNYAYVQFPIIFYGAGTHAERISTPVTVDRIAPTISKSIRIRAPNACMATPLF